MQVIARSEEARTGPGDATEAEDGASTPSCRWQSELLQDELPIEQSYSGVAVDYRIAFDATLGEFALLYFGEAGASTTNLLFQRFSSAGRSLGIPIPLQPTIDWPTTGGQWRFGLLGALRIGGAWVALWSQMYVAESAAADAAVERGIYAQRIEGGTALGKRTTLLSSQSYLLAHDALWTGRQLAIATVEGPVGASRLDAGASPVVRIHRFNEALSADGPATTLPADEGRAPFSQVQALRVAGDDQRLGLFFSFSRQDAPQDSEGAFVIVEGNTIRAGNPDLLARDGPSTDLSLGYGGGRFLACSAVPPVCRLVDSAKASPIGLPITFYGPSAYPPRAVLWSGERFWVAASVGEKAEAGRLLGWVDTAGRQGQELLHGNPPEKPFVSTSRYSLHEAASDALFWVDDRHENGTLGGATLMKLTRECASN